MMIFFKKLINLFKNMDETIITDTIETAVEPTETEVSTPEEATEVVETPIEEKDNYQPYVEPSVEERNLTE